MWFTVYICACEMLTFGFCLRDYRNVTTAIPVSYYVERVAIKVFFFCFLSGASNALVCNFLHSKITHGIRILNTVTSIV